MVLPDTESAARACDMTASYAHLRNAASAFRSRKAACCWSAAAALSSDSAASWAATRRHVRKGRSLSRMRKR